MADRTRRRVASLTLGWPLRTRDTVWCDTPARRATSNIDGPRSTLDSTPIPRPARPQAHPTPPGWAQPAARDVHRQAEDERSHPRSTPLTPSTVQPASGAVTRDVHAHS